jgi:hypothetical protein
MTDANAQQFNQLKDNNKTNTDNCDIIWIAKNAKYIEDAVR